MREMIKKVRPDYCPVCKKDYCVETFDMFENNLNISYKYDNNKLDLTKNNVYYMKCKLCNTRFIPNWCNKKYPIALNDKYLLNMFLDDFKQGGKT